MKTKPILRHRIKEVCKERGISVRELARLAKISSSELDRIVSGKKPLSLKQTMMICGALNANSYEIFGLKFDKKLINDLDDVLLGSATVWLAESCDLYKVKLSQSEYPHWISFIYKEVVSRNLNGYETHELAKTVVKVIEQVKRRGRN